MNNKGFAVTGFLYSILVLFIVIATLLIFNLQNKKVILDKLKSDALDNLENNINEDEEICSYEVGQEFTFDYTGSEQTFTVPCSGYYKLETWGAQGGNEGGKGAYTSGIITLHSQTNMYVYVGGTGSVSPAGIAQNTSGGYNGGGSTQGQDCCDRSFGSGGGATDIRLTSGAWNNQKSLASRIMVAAGGGGRFSDGTAVSNGGAGGALTGLNASGDYTDWCIGFGGTQTSGGMIGITSGKYCEEGSNTTYTQPGLITGGFGYGGAHGSQGNNSTGGGSGYYGGSSSGHIASAGGGSSYISGHTGCVAITSETDQSPKNGCKTGTTNNACSKHYSGLVFTDTNMIDGAGHTWTNSDMGVNSINLMPKPSGGYYASGTGHIGNGYAKITYLGKKKNAGKTKYIITNMISNGSFEDDFDNFTYKADNASISSTESAYGNKSYKRGTSTKAGGTTQYINVVEGHKYYYFLHSKSGSVTLWSDVSDTGWGAIQSKSTDWNKFGIIITATTTAKKNISLNYGDDITEDTYVDGVGFVDLTEAFGAGNEPSKEWCDIHIDYFDGTKAIYK